MNPSNEYPKPAEPVKSKQAARGIETPSQATQQQSPGEFFRAPNAAGSAGFERVPPPLLMSNEQTPTQSAPPTPPPPMQGMPAPPATPMIPLLSGMSTQPAVPLPPPAYGIPGQGQPAAPMAPPMYQIPAQPARPAMSYVPVTPAPPAPTLHMPATADPAARRVPSKAALYVVLSSLFLVAFFLVLLFAMRS